MLDLHPKYQVDERGNRVVVLSEEEYENLLAWAEVNSPDPDEGLKLRKDLRAELEKEMADYAAGKLRGKSLEQIERELDL